MFPTGEVSVVSEQEKVKFDGEKQSGEWQFFQERVSIVFSNERRKEPNQTGRIPAEETEKDETKRTKRINKENE